MVSILDFITLLCAIVQFSNVFYFLAKETKASFEAWRGHSHCSICHFSLNAVAINFASHIPLEFLIGWVTKEIPLSFWGLLFWFVLFCFLGHLSIFTSFELNSYYFSDSAGHPGSFSRMFLENGTATSLSRMHDASRQKQPWTWTRRN